MSSVTSTTIQSSPSDSIASDLVVTNDAGERIPMSSSSGSSSGNLHDFGSRTKYRVPWRHCKPCQLEVAQRKPSAWKQPQLAPIGYISSNQARSNTRLDVNNLITCVLLATDYLLGHRTSREALKLASDTFWKRSSQVCYLGIAMMTRNWNMDMLLTQIHSWILANYSQSITITKINRCPTQEAEETEC